MRNQGKPDADTLVERIRRRFISGLLLGLAVIIGLVLFANGPALLGALRAFDWWLLPLVLLLTVGNYLLRFIKWQLYLGWLGVRDIRPRTSLWIFLAGLSMAVTPGKVGEFLKSYLVRRATGTPISVTAPIVVAERVTDGLAMLGLAGVGLVSARYGWPVLGAIALVGLGAVLFLQRRNAVLGLLGRLERFALVAPRVRTLETLYESMWILLQPGHLLTAVGIGLVSWSGECFAFFLILVGLGLPASVHLLLIATFILATATIVGSLSMLPGGLGAAEAGVAGLLLLLVHGDMTTNLAAAATLMIRFATLWFGVLLGLGALLLVERHLARLEQPASASGLAVSRD